MDRASNCCEWGRFGGDGSRDQGNQGFHLPTCHVSRLFHPPSFCPGIHFPLLLRLLPTHASHAPLRRFGRYHRELTMKCAKVPCTKVHHLSKHVNDSIPICQHGYPNKCIVSRQSSYIGFQLLRPLSKLHRNRSSSSVSLQFGSLDCLLNRHRCLPILDRKSVDGGKVGADEVVG